MLFDLNRKNEPDTHHYNCPASSFVQKMIFAPLGMNATTFDYARALKGNHATPHGDRRGRNAAGGEHGV